MWTFSAKRRRYWGGGPNEKMMEALKNQPFPISVAFLPLSTHTCFNVSMYYFF